VSREAAQACNPGREPWGEAGTGKPQQGRKSGSQATSFQAEAFLDLVVILVVVIVAQVLGGA
jgi:hypothetical protein